MTTVQGQNVKGQGHKVTMDKHREVLEKPQVYQWRTDACRSMVSRNTRIKVHEIRGISFLWPAPPPLTRPNFGALRQEVCEISVVEMLLPEY